MCSNVLTIVASSLFMSLCPLSYYFLTFKKCCPRLDDNTFRHHTNTLRSHANTLRSHANSLRSHANTLRLATELHTDDRHLPMRPSPLDGRMERGLRNPLGGATDQRLTALCELQHLRRNTQPMHTGPPPVSIKSDSGLYRHSDGELNVTNAVATTLFAKGSVEKSLSNSVIAKGVDRC